MNDWYTFQEASLKMKKSRGYLSVYMKRNPSYFLEGSYKKSGRIWLINDEGIEYFKQHLKKEGDHVIALTST